MAQIERPKLVVGVVVDQMRWDYLYYYYNPIGWSNNVTHEMAENYWTTPGQDAKYPALGSINTDYTKKLSWMYIEDGSYLRLASVTLGYDIPFKNGKIVKNLGLSASVNNLYIWTKYTDWDPDVNSFGSNIKKMGCDLGSYPNNRAYSFDVKFTF